MIASPEPSRIYLQVIAYICASLHVYTYKPSRPHNETPLQRNAILLKRSLGFYALIVSANV